MKKIAAFSFIVLMSMTASSQAQTFLVDLYKSTPYNGNAAADFGVTGSVVDVGASSQQNNGTNSGDTYILGTSGLLTLNSQDDAYNNVSDDTTTDPLYLTGGYLFAEKFNGGGVQAATLSLVVAAGSSVDVEALGSWNDSDLGILTVSDGTSAYNGYVPQASGANGTGTFADIATFTNDSSALYTITFGYPDDGLEGDLSSLLITITPPVAASVPEPSTYVLLGVGIVGMVFLRKRFVAV